MMRHLGQVGLATVWVLCAAWGFGALPQRTIVMISDGTGLASLTVARQVKGSPLALDRAIYGLMETRSANASVTDSAAAATALACGVRTNNGMVGLAPDGTRVRSIAEVAKAEGKSVGIVTTDAITGATPAGFSAHAQHRSQTGLILSQQIASGFDLFLGGGRQALTEPLHAELVREGYSLVEDAAALRTASGKIFGLFSPGVMTAMVERRSGAPCSEPTLPEMATKALEVLEGNPQGFFLMIEGAQVDKGNHAHDLAWATHELLAFDETVALVLDWAAQHPGTVVAITADHETGGLVLLPEPHEGARAQAILGATAKGACSPAACSVHYATGDHSGADVFLGGNDPTRHPLRNCDLPAALGL
ncbi:MAG: alkaline phosphatase [Candidatus Spyradenecus sp.]